MRCKKYRESHKEELSIKNKLYQNTHKEEIRQSKNKKRLEIKNMVMTHYGNGKCACLMCGYDKDVDGLTIDHVNGHGEEHRRELNKHGLAFYRWLINSNYPEGYQTLCGTCELIKKSENREHYYTEKIYAE